MTPAERRIWFDILKNLPNRFLCQRVIGNYIVDFYCASKHLVIEVDGDSHYSPEALDYDAERTAFFEALGIRVIRFTNDDVIGNSDEVYDQLKKRDGKVTATLRVADAEIYYPIPSNPPKTRRANPISGRQNQTQPKAT